MQGKNSVLAMIFWVCANIAGAPCINPIEPSYGVYSSCFAMHCNCSRSVVSSHGDLLVIIRKTIN